MKIFLSHSSSFDFKKEFYEPICSAFEKNSNIILDLPHSKDLKPSRSLEKMKEASCLIVEASYPSTGSGIEIGWANSKNIPVLSLFKEGSQPSSSVSLSSKLITSYKSPEEMIGIIQAFIKPLL